VLFRSVNTAIFSRYMNSNTIMIVGSTPNFPHGIIDNIPALGKLAIKYKCGLHVDSCLGGFLIPFMTPEQLPHHTDFRVPGVTSISCDPHKYGFAPKGTSVIMYKSKELRAYQYHTMTDWPGGVYASPSVAGSRAGGVVAGCWASMVRMGRDGYISSTVKILNCQKMITAGIRQIEGLEVIGDPLVSVVAFRASGSHPNVGTYQVADIMSRKGWHLNILQFPPAIHIAVTLMTIKGADDLIGDLKESVAMLEVDATAGSGDVAAIYGSAATVGDRSIIGSVSFGFLDGLTMVKKEN